MRIVRELQSLGADDVRDIAASRSATVAIGEGVIRGFGAAALLLADYAVMMPGSKLDLECGGPSRRSGIADRNAAASAAALQIAGLIWRDTAYRLFLSGTTSFTAEEAKRLGFCDAMEWKWDGRSGIAFESAAQLIARRGGDALERAEFARLFATGEPQEGLAAFLEKRPPHFMAAGE